ncbi:hypothetical protein B0H19DRAFT_1274452 [Mycena capillaripes]|nr:hypothetical protein B0H19DRAFT_1274452 [Mycena capillaripes]
MSKEIQQNGLVRGLPPPGTFDPNYPVCNARFFPGDAFLGLRVWETAPVNLYHLVYNADEARIYTNSLERNEGMALLKSAHTSEHHGLYDLAHAIYRWCKDTHAHPTPARRSQRLQSAITSVFCLTTYDPAADKLLPVTLKHKCTTAHQEPGIIIARVPATPLRAPASTAPSQAKSAPPLRALTAPARTVSLPARVLAAPYPAPSSRASGHAAHICTAPARQLSPAAAVDPAAAAVNNVLAAPAAAEGPAAVAGDNVLAAPVTVAGYSEQDKGWIVSSDGDAFRDRDEAEAAANNKILKFKFVDTLEAGRAWYRSLSNH